MNYTFADTRNNSIFDSSSTLIKEYREWSMFRTIKEDTVAAFKVMSPRSSNEPQYTNILHINRYRTA